MPFAMLQEGNKWPAATLGVQFCMEYHVVSSFCREEDCSAHW